MSYKTSLSSDYKNCRSYSCIITTSLPVTSVVSWHLGLCHWCFQQILWSQEVFLPSHPKIYSIYLYLFCIRGSASGVYTCSFKNNTTLIIFTKKILHPYLFFFLFDHDMRTLWKNPPQTLGILSLFSFLHIAFAIKAKLQIWQQ